VRCQAGFGQVTLRPMTDNADARPRATLLLTRPREASEGFAAEIAQGDPPLYIVIAPLMEIAPVGAAPMLTQDDAIVFTSANAVPFAGAGNGRRAWCVGARTARVAREAGFDAVEAGECADALVDRLLQEPRGRRILHLRGRHQRGDVTERLRAAGHDAAAHVVYDQVSLPPDAAFSAALTRDHLIVPLFSPRSAALFAEAAQPGWHPGPEDRILALSAAVRAALPEEWKARARVVDRPDAAAMRDAIARRIFP
jgi:uroporphyrinogen-III synthase